MRCHLAVVALGLLCGCVDASDQPTPDVAPQASPFRLVDEIALRETDSIFIGRPTGVAVDRHGALYVTDNLEDRVVRFARDGRLSRTYGRSGRGPGELISPVRPGILQDSVLLVQDDRRQQVTAYRIADGQHLYDVPVRGAFSGLNTRNDTVWTGITDLQRQIGVLSWTGRDRTPRPMFPFPAMYRASRPMAMVFGYTVVLPLGDSLLVNFSPTNDLLMADLDGRVHRTVQLPVVRRRVAPADLERRYLEARTTDERARMAPLSYTAHQLPSGTVVLLIYDIDWPDQVTLRRAWLSLLTPDLERGCIDMPLPLTRDGTGHIAFQADTIVTVEQEVTGESVRLMSRRYVIDEAACPWQPLTAAQPEGG